VIGYKLFHSHEPCVIAVASIAVLCIFSACRDPFFPPTGKPDKTPSLRVTPDGVITQLINAYETKDLSLYQDLFPAAKTFHFYVSPSFVTSYNSGTRSYVNPPEPRDSLLIYTSEYSYYYYWTQDVEMQSHKKLFLKATSITFTEQPGRQYRPIINEAGDTTNFEVLMTNGEIVIETADPVDEYIIAIEKQVFLLERDVENQNPENRNLWVIRKWYDFGSQ
jgi:hypothetical protein